MITTPPTTTAAAAAAAAPRMTGLDVVALGKIVTQPINPSEIELIHTIKKYITEQGGSEAILHRASEQEGQNKRKKQQPQPQQRVRYKTTNDDDGGTISITNLMDFPAALLTRPLGYLDTKSIMIVSTLNKQLRGVVRGPGMEKGLYRRHLHISAAKERKNNVGRSAKLLDQLSSHCDRLQHYTDATFTDIHKFDQFSSTQEPYSLSLFSLRGITSLHVLTTSSFPTRNCNKSLLFGILRIMPNIQSITITGPSFHPGTLYFIGSVRPLLTKITWNGIGIFDKVIISGSVISNQRNLREIYMDDSSFFGLASFASPRYNGDQFIFQECSNDLERVSIRNARYYFYGHFNLQTIPVPQKELIKFVRNAPSLKWFRSDLTLDNIRMLQNECPGIELLS